MTDIIEDVDKSDNLKRAEALLLDTTGTTAAAFRMTGTLFPALTIEEKKHLSITTFYSLRDVDNIFVTKGNYEPVK